MRPRWLAPPVGTVGVTAAQLVTICLGLVVFTIVFKLRTETPLRGKIDDGIVQVTGEPVAALVGVQAQPAPLIPLIPVGATPPVTVSVIEITGGIGPPLAVTTIMQGRSVVPNPIGVASFGSQIFSTFSENGMAGGV